MSESDQLDFWTKLLRLDGFRVAHIRKDTPTDPVRLTVIPSTPLGLCPHCHRACDAIHRRWESNPIKDLPLGPQPVELIIRTYQFACPHCGHFFTPPAPVCAPGGPRHRALPGASRPPDPLQRHRQRRRLPGRPGEDPGEVVLRLRRTPTPGIFAPAPTDPATRH